MSSGYKCLQYGNDFFFYHHLVTENRLYFHASNYNKGRTFYYYMQNYNRGWQWHYAAHLINQFEIRYRILHLVLQLYQIVTLKIHLLIITKFFDRLYQGTTRKLMCCFHIHTSMSMLSTKPSQLAKPPFLHIIEYK